MKSISNLQLFPRAARTLLLMVAITLTALTAGAQDPTTQFPTTSGGAGTAESPYLIKTIDDLNTLSADVNSGTNYSGKYFRLESDLNYSGVTVDGGSNFTPIGWTTDFYGNFDGGNHTISGVKVEDNTHISCGLFGYVTNGTIKNLKVTNSSFQCSDTNAKVGGIVGDADNSTVENCHTTSDVSVTGYETGGVVGKMRNSAKVIACTSAADVKGVYVGGILGNYTQSSGSGYELKYCFYYGSSVTQPSNVGSASGHGAIYGGIGPAPLDCYYQSTVWGAYSGMDIETSQHGYTITLEDGISMSGYDTEADRTITLPSGEILNIFSDGYSYLGQRYFRYGATVTLSDNQTVDDGYTPGGYVNTDGAMGPEVYGSEGLKNYSSVLSGSTLTMGTCNVTISMASKTPITYNITYDLVGGTVTTVNPATYNIETDDFTLTNPTKTGYTFAGWTGTDLTDPTLTVTIPKGSLGDRTYTATWTITTYNITYDLAGGTVATANPTSYTVETNDFTLNNPTRSGYDFLGWHGTDIDNLSTTVTIAKGSTGNRTYTALWKPNSGSGDWSDHAATSFATINTSAKTLSIASEAEMALFAKNASIYAAYTVTLTKDLDLKDYLWKPIVGFNGTFDGQGHTISGVMIESTDGSQGLFGVFGKSAKVRNLVIANSYISGGNNTGAVVGATDGTSEDASLIENCHVMESVTITGTEGASYGGIAGYSGGSIIACSSAAMMSAQGNNTAGIVGSGYKIDQCLYYGTILPSDRGGTVWAIADGSVGCTNYQTYDAKSSSHKYVRVYDADPGIMGTVTKEYSDTGYKVYEKGVSYGGKFYTAVVALTEDGITDLTAYAGQTIDVAFRRSFTAGKPSTVCLPFAYTPQGEEKFYSFTGINEDGGNYTADMTEVVSPLVANTPYLFMPTGNADFSGTYAIPASITAGSTISGDWTFKGTYSTIEWTDAPAEPTYGFSAQDANAGITQGQFVKVGSYVRIKPMRAYLQYNGSDSQFTNARSLTRAAATTSDDTLPETIGVRLISANGEVTAIGTLHTRTGEVSFDSEAWYTLDGKRLNAKPTTKGIYVNNGKKVVIK